MWSSSKQLLGGIALRELVLPESVDAGLCALHLLTLGHMVALEVSHMTTL